MFAMDKMTPTQPEKPQAFANSATARLAIAVLTAVLAGAATQSVAQSGPFENGASVPQKETAEAIGIKNGSFIVAPVPFSSPSLGAGLALGGAYLFRADDGSNSSTVGFGAFKSDNDSEGYALGWDVNFSEGLWTTSFLFADADLNYDLFVARVAVPVSQSVQGYSIGFARSVSDNVEIGIGLSYAESSVWLRDGGLLPPEFEEDGQLKLGRLRFDVERDLRDDIFTRPQVRS
ncbi:MAG: hypothetical protein AAFO97_08090 [Pseudomonadota bacterium]